MTRNEIELLRLALRWRRAYEDSNPDVGMGPSEEYLLDDLARMAGITLTPEDKAVLLNRT